ncbi:tail fiber domain-containing protein [Candidatus Zixiibacteriota bacterium]
MSFRNMLCLIAVAILLGAALTAQAEVPQTINLQGILLDTGGDPVVGPVSVTFTIYDDPSAGTDLWTETRSVSPDAEGRFTITLGEVEPIDDTIFNDPDRWLGIQVGADPEITPRQKLTSGAYANVASNIGLPWESCEHVEEGIIRLCNPRPNGLDSTAVIIACDTVAVTGRAVGRSLTAHRRYGVSGVWTNGDYTTFGALGASLYGVYGLGGQFGVRGYGDDYGVFGFSEDGIGMYARGWNAGSTGLLADNNASGIWVTLADDSVGVFGHAENSNDFAVLGENEATGCIGYLGLSKGVSGVHSSSGNGGYIGGSQGGVYGAGNEASAFGVKGENFISQHYGYLGGEFYGAYGIHTSGNSGFLGGATSGAWGEHSNGNYGFLGDDEYGAYGWVSGNYGYLGGDSVGVYGNGTYAGLFEGKVYVDGDVGIGTASPNGPLHIESGMSISNPTHYDDREAPLVIGDGDGSGACLLIDGNQIEIAAGNSLHINTASAEDVFMVVGGGDVGIGTDSPSYKLDVNGDIECVALHETSDGRLKTNIAPLTDALDKIQQVRGVTFAWNEAAESFGAEVGKQQIGVIAQELESIFPELVTTAADGYKAVDYTKLTPVLIEAVKDLKTENDAMRAQMAEMQTMLQQLLEDKQ